ncbi:glycoside hydrolase superfamily [Trichoderma sp. SZMC 28012]
MPRLELVYLGLGIAGVTAAPTASTATPLKVISFAQTPNGFQGPARGWNSFALQANPNTAPDFQFDQSHVLTQCSVLASGSFKGQYDTCSLDSGWSVGDHGDDNGRLIYDDSIFDIPSLASSLHSQGLKMGVYVVPGAFISDANKTILGTETTIGEVCTGNEGLLRCIFDYTRSETQTWHNSVVDQFASWGVDFVKLDFVTPGSPDNGQSLPADQSGSVIAWHNAIKNSGRQMRLDISWKLDRTQTYFDIWNSNADSMRTDQDLNNSGSSTLVSWGTVQRAIDNYRQWIIAGLQFFDELNIYPDMDNLAVGSPESISGLSDGQRTTVMTHWIGAGANLITGNDMTQLDDLGTNLLTNAQALQVAAFTAQYPMQPRNPGSGGQDATQLQAWIAGPSPSGEAVVVLVNLGPDNGQGGFGTQTSGVQTVTATWQDLGLSGQFNVQDIWNNKSLGVIGDQVSAQLDEGASVLLHLTSA